MDIKHQIHFGRRIVEGEKKVKIFGEEIAVNAEVVYIDGYSGHADQRLLMNFVGEFKEKPKKIFLVHGEEEAQNVLKSKIEEEYGIETEIPSFGDVFRVDEIVEKEENLLEKEKVVATREEKIDFANKVSDLNEEISILSDTIADRMTHVHVKSENIVNDTDMGILQEVLIKLGKLEDPEFKVKEAIIVTLYPGASPENVEQEVGELEDTIKLILKEKKKEDIIKNETLEKDKNDDKDLKENITEDNNKIEIESEEKQEKPIKKRGRPKKVKEEVKTDKVVEELDDIDDII